MNSKHRKCASSDLWNKSPCSYNFSQQSAFIQKEQRFSYGSIYQSANYKSTQNNPNRSDHYDLLKKFRATLNDADYSKKYKKLLKNTHPPKAKQPSQQISRKYRNTLGNYLNLYEVPPKNAFKFDRYGNRSYEIGEYDVKDIQSKLVCIKKGFSLGRRMDLSRPLNFVPGPGTYLSEQVDNMKSNKDSIKLEQLKDYTSSKESSISSRNLPPFKQLLNLNSSHQQIPDSRPTKRPPLTKLKKLSLEQINNHSKALKKTSQRLHQKQLQEQLSEQKQQNKLLLRY